MGSGGSEEASMLMGTLNEEAGVPPTTGCIPGDPGRKAVQLGAEAVMPHGRRHAFRIQVPGLHCAGGKGADDGIKGTEQGRGQNVLVTYKPCLRSNLLKKNST